jgi:hypothetical protein
MSLRAQIELMTVPQEFARLCNSVLIAEHGDDFLPIDDDRADRGNDGYLKSEQCMFAVHCFKRIQNRSIDAPIRAKMIGDLGKSIALKAAGVWPVQAWTFLSNYPIPEHIGSEVVQIGRDAGIEVSWRRPDYFATVLSQRPELLSEFPDIQANELAAQIREIRDAVVDPVPDSELREHTGTPRNLEEQARLLEDRPPGWEYLLFAGILYQRRTALESKWRGHELGVPARDRHAVRAEEATDYLAAQFGRLGALMEPMTRVFEGQEAAFGAPGEPGDPIRIEHFAEWVLNAYEDAMDWQAAIRAADMPEEFDDARELCAQAADRPLQQIRDFIDAFINSAEGIPEFLQKSDEERKRQPLVIEHELALEMDHDLMDRALKAIRKAVRLS